MESLPTLVAGTAESSPIQPRAGPDLGAQATDMNSFVGLTVPLLAHPTTIDPSAQLVTRTRVAQGVAQGLSGHGTPALRPMIASQLPHERPVLASLSGPRLQAQTALAKPDALRSSPRMVWPDRMPFMEVASADSAYDDHAVLRRSVPPPSLHESYTSNAITRDVPSESDRQGETLRVMRLNHASPDLGPLTQVVKPADATTVAQNIVAKHAPLPVDQPAVFGQRLEQHIAVMLTRQVHHARIAVSPPELGPLEARVTVIGDEATVQLISPHAATRDALEDALPRLRSLFTDSGLALAHAGVFTETPRHRSDHSATHADDAHNEALAQDAASIPANAVKVRLGLIDAYV